MPQNLARRSERLSDALTDDDSQNESGSRCRLQSTGLDVDKYWICHIKTTNEPTFVYESSSSTTQWNHALPQERGPRRTWSKALYQAIADAQVWCDTGSAFPEPTCEARRAGLPETLMVVLRR